MTGKILVILADGFEEVEAFAPVDVLRRIGLDVITASLRGETAKGAHGIVVSVDCELDSVDPSGIRVVILPGGMPGSKNLRESDKVMDILNKVYSAQGVVAAICAAPIALSRAGLLKGRRITAYPGFEDMLEGAECTGARSEVDGRIITAKGPGASFEFAKLIARAVGKREEAKKVLEGMFVE